MANQCLIENCAAKQPHLHGLYGSTAICFNHYHSVPMASLDVALKYLISGNAPAARGLRSCLGPPTIRRRRRLRTMILRPRLPPRRKPRA